MYEVHEPGENLVCWMYEVHEPGEIPVCWMLRSMNINEVLETQIIEKVSVLS